MKVVYKKSMSDKIMEEIVKAKEAGNEIEKIILTKLEYDELAKELNEMLVFKIKLFGDYQVPISIADVLVECVN